MKPVLLRPRTVVLLGAYALALHALLYVSVWKTNFIHLAQKTLGLAPHEEHELPLYRAMLAWSERDRSVPDGALLVLGDSMLQNLDAARLGLDVCNFALGGSTIHTLRQGLPVLRSLALARVIVLGIGVNDLKYREPAEIAGDYAALLALLPTGTPVITVPILPVDESNPAVQKQRFLSNSRLLALEAALGPVSAARPGTRRLDPTTFADPNGVLRSELHCGDGWHPSAAGAAELRRLIRGELEALFPDRE
jgi:lysophospholipase L1-like esterase